MVSVNLFVGLQAQGVRFLLLTGRHTVAAIRKLVDAQETEDGPTALSQDSTGGMLHSSAVLPCTPDLCQGSVSTAR